MATENNTNNQKQEVEVRDQGTLIRSQRTVTNRRAIP